MPTYEVTSARTSTADGEEFLIISIPPEQYHHDAIRNNWFAAFRAVEVPFVIGSVTKKEEWTFRSERTDLTEYLAGLPFGTVDRLDWRRMRVETEHPLPWEV